MQEYNINSSNEIKICPSQGVEMGGQQTTRVRDDRIDAVKYWLIVLVIAGHVFTRKGFVDSTSCVILGEWIYIFHMPLFIFLSGYFSRKKDLKDFWPSLWKIIEPLIIFHVIISLPKILHGDTNHLIKTIFTPWWVLWYLLSLIYWRLMLQFIPSRVFRHTKIVLIGAFCLSLLSGFLPFDRFLSLQRTLAFMPFFFMGYYMRGKNLYLPGKYKTLCVLFLILMFAIPMFFPQCLGNLRHADPYGNIIDAVKRTCVFALSIPMSIAFLNVCYNTQWIAQQGRMTMQYYIFHALIIPPLMIVVGKLDIPMTFATATIITLGIVLGIGLVLKIPYVKMLTNPSLFLKSNTKE